MNLEKSLDLSDGATLVSILQETPGGRCAFSVLTLTLKHQGVLVILSWELP